MERDAPLVRRARGRRRQGRTPGCQEADALTQIECAPEVADDFERILNHLATHGALDAAACIHDIVAAIDVLARNPVIGRPGGPANRELVIGRPGNRSRAYLALYRYIAAIDTVFVLAIRSQAEAGYAGR